MRSAAAAAVAKKAIAAHDRKSAIEAFEKSVGSFMLKCIKAG